MLPILYRFNHHTDDCRPDRKQGGRSAIGNSSRWNQQFKIVGQESTPIQLVAHG